MSDWWDGVPWRMIQTNLREIDMLDIDADRVVRDLLDFRATALLLNAAGIIASYRTALPYHFQSPYLKGSSLKDIIAACHEAGIRVLARTDFSKVRRPIYEEHPDWAYISPEGTIIDYNGDVHVCLNSDYQQHYALEIIREVITTHDFDGIFFNMSGYQVRDYTGNYYGICQCPNCQLRFAEMYALPLPTVEDPADPVYRRYTLFKRETVAEHQEKVYHLIQSLRPELCVANHRRFGRGVIRQESNTALERPLPHWQYSASDNTRWATTNYPEMVSSNTTVDFIDYPYRHVSVSPEQQRLRLAQSLANGGALDYYLIGRLDNHEDKSGYLAVRELFHYHADHEDDYVNLRSCANVALLSGPDSNQAEYRGWFRFLMEHHYLFDTLLVERALDLDWSRYRAIVVPDYQPIGDELAERLDAYVRAGGVLVATGRAAFRDGELEERPRPAIEALGLRRVLRIREDMRSSYLRIEDTAPWRRLPLTRLIYLDGPYVYADYADGAERHLRLVPPHPFGPPERCYYTQVTDHPGLVVNPYGAGRATYIPWLPGALYHRQGHTNTFAFAGDVLSRFAGLPSVGGDLSPMVEVTLFEQVGRGHRLLHLVNASGHYGVTFYPPVPMRDLHLRLPGVPTPRAVTSLVSGEECAFEARDGVLRIDVPELGLLQALKLWYDGEGGA